MTAATERIELGAVVVDREHQQGEHQQGEQRLVAINTPPESADEWELTNYGRTVADANPGCEPDDDVAICVREPELDEHHPSYRGERPLTLTDIDIWFKAYPVERLRLVDHRADDVRGGDR